jgi:hypothetical protein
MGMSRHDAYYEPDDYDDRSDEIEERTWQLMKVGAQYDFKTSGAVAEALGDMSIDDAKDLQAVIDTGNYEHIGRKILMLAESYMEHFAKNAAENEIND